jgi:hypothetical protein
MKDWIECDDMTYNEKIGVVIEWCVYGDDVKYFLSQEYDFKDDIYDNESERFTLVNEEITEENTLEKLIEKTKSMR